jgi:hypothetical protein
MDRLRRQSKFVGAVSIGRLENGTGVRKEPDFMAMTILPLSDHYRETIRTSLVQQTFAALICLLLLDCGRMARICGVTSVGFWAIVSLIMASRPESPRQRDLMLIRWGFQPFFAAAWIWANFGM